MAKRIEMGNESFLDRMFKPKPYTPQGRGEKRTKSTYTFVWISMFLSLVLYYQAVGMTNLDKYERTPPIKLMFYGVVMLSFISLSFALLVSRLAISTEKLKLCESKNQMIAHVFTWGIISMALFESISIYGLFLYFIGYSGSIVPPFIIVSAMGFILNYGYFNTAWNHIAKTPHK